MRDFRRVWLSGAISGIGSWLLIVALPVHVFALTGSAVATGLTLALEALPPLLIGPWAGVLLDRWDLAKAMWIADLVSAAAVALILAADHLWLIYVAILLENTASTVFRPAGRALLPAIVGTGNELAKANALTAGTGSAIRLVAPPLGALLLAGPGIEFVLVADILSYLASAAIIATIRTRRRTATERPHPAAGFQTIRRHRGLRGILIGQTVFLTANAGLTALLVPFTVDRLHADGYVVGYLIAGLGAGYLLGAALSTYAARLLHTRELLVATQLATAAAYFALFNAPDVPIAIVAAGLIGVPGSILLITAETTIQRTAPTAVLAGVGALFFAADSLALLIGALTAPAASLVAGLPLTLNLLATLAVAAAACTLIVVPRHPAHFLPMRDRPTAER